jgi:hypothetical protein
LATWEMLCQSGDTDGSEGRLPCQGVEVWLYRELPIERDNQEVKGAPRLDLRAVNVDGEGGGGLPLAADHHLRFCLVKS